MKRIIATLGTLAVLVPVVFLVCLSIWGAWHDEWSGYNASVAMSDGFCNIAIVPIIGDITSMGMPPDEEGVAITATDADQTVGLIRAAESDPAVKGIVLRIDSYGGYPGGSSVIADAVNESSIPVAAVIREAGTSGAYLAASAADTIVASPYADVGGIGITMSYVGNWLKNEKEGLTYVPLSSAKFKDYGNPERALTDEERSLLMRDLAIWHEQFVTDVANNRGMSRDDVMRLADGSSLPGTLARDVGLVDSVGNQESTRAWFARELGIPEDEVEFCG